ncbi:unnamed protein product [Allacma fusca]|uniref:Uncharacterized protein n=1 Tax=Allacma fusca TaxID=39272 RepID=A0A8J2KRT8_9HEXA|nr:unnamed protein product [Allacma fusca]
MPNSRKGVVTNNISAKNGGTSNRNPEIAVPSHSDDELENSRSLLLGLRRDVRKSKSTLDAIEKALSVAGVQSSQNEEVELLPCGEGFAVKAKFRDVRTSDTKKFTIKSWRYLIVTIKDGSGERYFESDGVKAVWAKKEWLPALKPRKSVNVPGPSQVS